MILMDEYSIDASRLDRILIAGAFGQFIRKSSALAIGLIPAIDPEKVHFVGNAAGVGARIMLCDQRTADRADAIRTRTEYFEMGARDDYQDAFASAMGFHNCPALEGA